MLQVPYNCNISEGTVHWQPPWTVQRGANWSYLFAIWDMVI